MSIPSSDEIATHQQLHQQFAQGSSSADMPSYLKSKFSEIHLTKTPRGIVETQKPLLLQPQPSGKRMNPSKQGNSYETPTFMRTRHGLISKDTYNNPFLSPNTADETIPATRTSSTRSAHTSSSLKNKQTFNIFSSQVDPHSNQIFHIQEITTKPTYNLLTHEKRDSGKLVLPINERPQFSDEYSKIINKDNGSGNAMITPFHRKFNYFSDFVQRNDAMNVFGPISSRQRNSEFQNVKDFSRTSTERIFGRNQGSRSITPMRTPRLKLTPSIPNSRQSSAEKDPTTMIPIKNQRSTRSEDNSLHLQPNESRNQWVNSDIKLAGMLLQKNNLTGQASSSVTSNFFKSRRTMSELKLRPTIARRVQDTSILPKTYSPLQKDHLNEIPIRLLKKQELESIDEFEKQIRLLQGNSLAGSKMGSVFFKACNR